MMKGNIEKIKSQIRETLENCGREGDEVTLIAVSKTQPSSRINEAVSCGITDIGENYVQEFIGKYSEILGKDKINFHFIGHLQKNKVKYIVDKVSLIHSLDSFELAKEIDKQSKKISKVTNVLIQVNLVNEPSKSGVDRENLYELISEVSKLENVKISGLMAIPPFYYDEQELKGYYSEMRRLFEDIKGKNFENVEMKYLSMGMSNDFAIALKEGSNMIRIGTAIFGQRVYNK